MNTESDTMNESTFSDIKKINGYENRVFRDEKGTIISLAPSVFSAITLTVDKSMCEKKDITSEKLVERLKATFLENENAMLDMNGITGIWR